jgi:hypothetical protein
MCRNGFDLSDLFSRRALITAWVDTRVCSGAPPKKYARRKERLWQLLSDRYCLQLPGEIETKRMDTHRNNRASYPHPAAANQHSSESTQVSLQSDGVHLKHLGFPEYLRIMPEHSIGGWVVGAGAPAQQAPHGTKGSYSSHIWWPMTVCLAAAPPAAPHKSALAEAAVCKGVEAIEAPAACHACAAPWKTSLAVPCLEHGTKGPGA